MSITWVLKYFKQYLCMTLLSRYYEGVSAFLSHANLFLGKEESLSEDCSLSLHESGGDLLFPIITACTLDFLGSLPSSSHFCHRRQNSPEARTSLFLGAITFPSHQEVPPTASCSEPVCTYTCAAVCAPRWHQRASVWSNGEGFLNHCLELSLNVSPKLLDDVPPAELVPVAQR